MLFSVLCNLLPKLLSCDSEPFSDTVLDTFELSSIGLQQEYIRALSGKLLLGICELLSATYKTCKPFSDSR